jgi:hypothetical protein
MEHIERPESIIRRVGSAKAPGPNEIGAKRVLYGVWDGTKKAVESQMPEAWKGRIIKIIDRQIIPRLPPDKQQWVDDHWDGIEEAAAYAGVGITTAEIVGAVVAVKYGADALWQHFRKRDPNNYFDALELLWRSENGNDTKSALVFANTMRQMAGDIAYQGKGVTTQWEAITHLALSKHKDVAYQKMQEQFVRSCLSATKQMHIRFSAEEANRLYHVWGERHFPGIDAILLSVQYPHPIEAATAAKAIHRLVGGSPVPVLYEQVMENALSGMPVPTETLRELAFDPKWQSTFRDARISFEEQDYREKAEQARTIARMLRKEQKLAAEQVLHEKNRAVDRMKRSPAHAAKRRGVSRHHQIEARVRQMDARLQEVKEQARQWQLEPKLEDHRFVKGELIIDPHSAPLPEETPDIETWITQELDRKRKAFIKQREDKIANIHAIVEKLPGRMDVIRQRMDIRHSLPPFEDRLRAALDARFPQTLQVERPLLDTVLTQVHLRHTDPAISSLLSQVERGNEKERIHASTVLFQTIFSDLPTEERDRLLQPIDPRVDRNTLVNNLAYFWTTIMHNDGVNVVSGHDLRDMLTAVTATPSKREAPWSWQWQADVLLSNIKRRYGTPKMVEAVHHVADASPWSMQRDGQYEPTRELVELLYQGMQGVSEKNFVHMGAVSEFGSELVDDARKHGKNPLRYIANDLAREFVNHEEGRQLLLDLYRTFHISQK